MKKMMSLFILALLCSCASGPNYPSYWPEEAKNQGITKALILYEFSFDDNCDPQIKFNLTRQDEMFAAIAESRKSEVMRTSEKNYFYTEELQNEYLSRVKEVSPRWYKKLTTPLKPGQNRTAMTTAEAKEYPKIEALQQELINSRDSNIPMYAITRALPSAGRKLENVQAIFAEESVPESHLRLLECRFDSSDELVESSLYYIVEGKLEKIGSLDSLKAMDNRVMLTLRVED